MDRWRSRVGRRAMAVALVVAAAAALFVGVLSGRSRLAPPPSARPPALSALATNPDLDPGTALGGRPAPGFQLGNQFDHPASLQQWRGRVVVLAFVDSRPASRWLAWWRIPRRCPCPTSPVFRPPTDSPRRGSFSPAP
ncbi:MAG: hypothetical protein M0Z54_06555 [Thermaerobacter sp.]|nr:hypothetical protein [Thermaerobacter sp.]